MFNISLPSYLSRSNSSFSLFKFKLIASIRRIETFGLVGRSGTGKSHSATYIASQFEIDTILDDGLLIQNAKILGGKSAKNEQTSIAAVKRAIFTEDSDVLEMRATVIEHKIKKILIIGTSVKMLDRIIERVGFPKPVKIVNIESYLSEEQIRYANRRRKKYGYHTIPVQHIEVKSRYPEIVLEQIFKKMTHPFKTNKCANSNASFTLVTPHYEQHNNISILEITLKDFVAECISRFDPSLKPNKIIMKKNGVTNSLDLKIFTGVSYGSNIQKITFPLYQHIRNTIKEQTGIELQNIDIVFNKLMVR